MEEPILSLHFSLSSIQGSCERGYVKMLPVEEMQAK